MSVPIHTFRSPKIELRSSNIGGRGLFAIAPISKGEMVAVKTGHVVNKTEVDQLTQDLGDYALQIYDDVYLSPRTQKEVEDTVVFINHSCRANVGFVGNVVYVALRDIAVGEELCHDYAMMRSDDYRLECRCGADICRGTVTGDDWKLAALQDLYGEFFQAHIMNKIYAQRNRWVEGDF